MACCNAPPLDARRPSSFSLMHFTSRPLMRPLYFLLTFSLLLGYASLAPDSSLAQDAPFGTPPTSSDPLTLTVDEALEIALLNNYALRQARLDVEEADAQIGEAWGQVLPSLNASSQYTRNLQEPNPFAGSDAGGLFQSFGLIDWLAYNEQARTGRTPDTEPIPLDEFQRLRQEGLGEAGIATDQGNPFAVPNQFQGGLTLSQTLYSASAFAAVRGARQLREVTARGVDRETQRLLSEVRATFYQAQLAADQARITRLSVDRARETLNETARRVSQGTAPKFERLSAEVQLSNLETNLLAVENAAETALDGLKQSIGLPVKTPIELRGSIEDMASDDLVRQVSVDDALTRALQNRPDLRQAQLAIELNQIQRRITRGQRLPTVSAFANLNYIGNVPDDRQFVLSDPEDPFSFQTESRGFFDGSFWDPAVSVGIRLSWNIFNGNQTRAQLQQNSIAIRRAEVQREQLEQGIVLEVEQAVRDLRTAAQRIRSQERNVETAELNYTFAQRRLEEGMARPIEEREASQQLDQSRLNYLQALYDYATALSALGTAIGEPQLPFETNDFLRFTRR